VCPYATPKACEDKRLRTRDVDDRDGQRIRGGRRSSVLFHYEDVSAVPIEGTRSIKQRTRRRFEVTLSRTRVIALIAGLVGMFALTPAMAQSSPDGGSFNLKLYAIKGDLDGNGSSPRLQIIAEGHLDCPEGSTPEKDAACEDLSTAHGFIDRIAEGPGFCTQEYSPVYAVAEGRWKGETRLFGKVFDNRCTAVKATGGHLFQI
jgi:hypothetical protein